MSSNDSITIVFRMPHRAAERRKLELVLDSLAKHQIARSNEDSIALLEILVETGVLDDATIDAARRRIAEHQSDASKKASLPDGYRLLTDDDDRSRAVLAFVRAGETYLATWSGEIRRKVFPRDQWVPFAQLPPEFVADPARPLAGIQADVFEGSNVTTLRARRTGST